MNSEKQTFAELIATLAGLFLVVAFAPLKPAEFVIIKIAQLAGQAQA